MKMAYPKNYNRQMLINRGTEGAPDWRVIAKGILSRANNINETTSKLHYLDGRGTAETLVEGQDVSAAFTGHRFLSDTVQDYILDELLFDLDRREVEFVDFDDSIAIPSSGTKPANGWRGKATIQITDFGSGEAINRQNIAFTLNYNGKPTRGTMEKTESGYAWTPKE